MIEIDYKLLNPDTLNSLLSEIVLREGTDYGSHELSHFAKVDQLKANLEKGKCTLMYCNDQDHCYIAEK